MFTKSYLSNLLMILFVSQLFIISGFSQNTSYLDSLDGKFALQFQISDNFNLASFQGTTFSGKYHFGCRSAVRVGLSINLNNSDAENNQTFLDSNLTVSTDGHQNVFGMTIKTQYIHYIPGMYNIMLFLGGGPFVGFSTGTNEVNYSNNDPTYRKETLDDFYVGLDLLIGVEWMYSKNMSLSAEYGIVFLYSKSTRKSDDNYSVKETIAKRYNIENGDVNFGITVYF